MPGMCRSTGFDGTAGAGAHAPRHRIASAGVLAALLGTALALALPMVACAQSLGLRIEAGVTHDDNVMRARKGGSDLKSDQSYALNVTKNFNFQVSTRTRLTVGLTLGGEKFARFDGLSRAGYTVNASYQFRPSGEFLAPTFSVFARAGADYFDSNLRDGYRQSVGLSVRKPFTDRIEFSLIGQYNRRDGRSTVFDGSDWSGRFLMDYRVFERDTFYFGAEYRRGDVVSVGIPQLASIDVAKSLVQDDVFTDTTRFAYRFDANTVIATVGYNWPFLSRHSLDLSWRWIRSEPRRDSAYYQGDLQYVVNQVSLAYLVRF